MKLHLCDKNPAVVAAWREAFADTPDVTVSRGDILELEGDAIVSPANSFGWMDGGIDLAYIKRFGSPVEQALRRRIEIMHDGELPVGVATAVDTNDWRIPLLISAPTMRIPTRVPNTVNAYLAMRAALITFLLRPWSPANKYGDLLLCPGLCTLTGRMPPMQAAEQMRQAWHVVTERHHPPVSVSELVNAHHEMLVPR